MRFWTILMLGIAANLDNLGIGLAYGLKGIKVPFASNLFIAILSGVATLLSAFLGNHLSNLFPERTSNAIGGAIVCIIGLWILAQYLIEEYFPETQPTPVSQNETKLSWRNIGTIFTNPTSADQDNSKVISLAESLLLGIALAINCLTSGLGAGMTGLNPFALALSITLFSLLSISAGGHLARHYASTRLGDKANLITGIMIILIGLYEIFF